MPNPASTPFPQPNPNFSSQLPTAPKTRTVLLRQWISLSLLVLIGIVCILDRSTLALANSDVSRDLKLDPAKMGLLLSGFSIAYSLSQLPLGIILDRLGARLVLGAGLLLWSIAQLCGGFVHTLRQFMVARIFLGIGESPTYPAGAKVIAEWFNQRERGRPTGIFLASPTIAPALAPPIITGLMLAFGWRRMFIIMGAAGIVLAAIWYLLMRDRKHVSLTPAESAYFDSTNDIAALQRTLSLNEWLQLFLQPSTWGIVGGFVGVIYTIWLYINWLPGYLEFERHLTVARTGWVASIPYLFGTLGALACGWAADFLLSRGFSPIDSRKWPICVGLVGTALFTILVAFTPNTVTAVIYLCFVMFFIYLASAGAWALVNVAAPNHMVAAVGCLQNFGGYLGGSFAPVVTGFLVKHTHSFAGSLVLSSAVSFISALVYFTLVTHPIRDSNAARS